MLHNVRSTPGWDSKQVYLSKKLNANCQYMRSKLIDRKFSSQFTNLLIISAQCKMECYSTLEYTNDWFKLDKSNQSQLDISHNITTKHQIDRTRAMLDVGVMMNEWRKNGLNQSARLDKIGTTNWRRIHH